MANPIDKGTQDIKINFKQNITAQDQNEAFHGVVPKGIYSGGSLERVGSVGMYTVQVLPMIIFIEDTDNEVSIRVQTTTSYSLPLGECTTTTPYIIAEFDWQNAENNYMDIRAIDTPTGNHLILGKATFDGTELEPVFDLTERKTAFLSSMDQVGDTLTISSKVIIDGDLSITGSQDVEVADEIITVNSDQVGTPDTNLLSGLEIERGGETNFQIVYRESDGVLTTGLIGDLKRVSTISDTPITKGVTFWNDTTKRLETNSGLTFEEVSTVPQLSLLGSGTRRLSFGETGDTFQSGIEYNGTNILLYPSFNSGNPTLALSPTHGYLINGTTNVWGIGENSNDLVIRDITGSHDIVKIDASEKKVTIDGTLEVTGDVIDSTRQELNKIQTAQKFYPDYPSISELGTASKSIVITDRKDSFQNSKYYVWMTYYDFSNTEGFVISSSLPDFLGGESYTPLSLGVSNRPLGCYILGEPQTDATGIFNEDVLVVINGGHPYKLSTVNGTKVATELTSVPSSPTSGVLFARDTINNRAFLVGPTNSRTVWKSDYTSNWLTWTSVAISTTENYFSMVYNPVDQALVARSYPDGNTITIAKSNTNVDAFTFVTITETFSIYSGSRESEIYYFKGKYFVSVCGALGTGIFKIYESTDAVTWVEGFSIFSQELADNGWVYGISYSICTENTLYIFGKRDILYTEDGIEWFSITNNVGIEDSYTLRYNEVDGSIISSPKVEGARTDLAGPIWYGNILTGDQMKEAVKLN